MWKVFLLMFWHGLEGLESKDTYVLSKFYNFEFNFKGNTTFQLIK